jgi:thymidylate synthase
MPVHWNPKLPELAGDTPVFGGAYGHRLRRQFGIDQLDRVYRALDAAPDSRQTVLQIWDSASDLPNDDGRSRRGDIPCNVVALPKIRNGRLEWLQVMRSNDVFLGLPHNVVQFTTLQEMMAGWLRVEAGSYHHLADSLHVYEDKLPAVAASTVAVPIEPNSDSFALPRAAWDQAVAGVVRRLDAMIAPEMTERLLRSLALTGDLPLAYEHSVRIAAADSALRRGWPDLAEECAEECRNAALRTLWRRWATRTRKNSDDPE